MRILLVSTARGIPWHGPSGASSHLRGVARALRAAGHHVTVLIGALGSGPVEDHVRSLPLPTWPRSRRRRERAERAQAARLMQLAPTDVDLVWHRHGLHDDAVRRWCQRHRITRWLEVNAPLSLERALLDPLGDPRRARRDEARSVREADRVWVVSRWLLTWARSLGARRVHWLPNGTALPRGDRSTFRRQQGLSGTVIGFVGSCRPWHGLHRLPELLDALPDASGLLVGDGPARPSHPRLHHVPYHPEPADAVASMDVGVVLGGLPWVCPLKVFDYRGQGVPTVAVPVGDVPNLSRWLPSSHVLPWGPAWAARVRAVAGIGAPARRTWLDVVGEALRTLPSPG